MNRLFRFQLLECVVALGLLWFPATSLTAAEPAKVDPLDWPFWRGPEMNGISREKNLPGSWSPDGDNLLWKSTDLATRSTPIVFRGKLYTVCRHHPETTKEGEKLVCADAATGKILWENANNVYLSDAPAERVGWSSPVADTATGKIYTLGLGGYFKCVDGETGKTLWSRSLSEEYGLLSTYGGRTNFPVVFDNYVIISAVMTGWGDNALPAHRFVGFDKTTGEAAWISSTRLRPEDTTYSSPILAVFNGQAAIVFGAGDGSVYALQPRTGKIIWKYDASIRGINTTPLVVGNTVYSSHSEETAADNSVMGALFAIDGTGTGDVTKTKELWSSPTRMIGRAAPLLIDNRLYVVDDGANLFIVDPKTGKDVGKKQKVGTAMMGSPVYGDGKIYVGDISGRASILEPNAKGVKVLNQVRLDGEEILASPIISHGRVYFATNEAMYCIGDKDAKPSADSRPPAPEETPVAKDQKPAQVQVYPVEAMVHSGKKQPFEVRLFNANGQFLKTTQAKFSLKGPGSIDDAGVYSAPADAGHSAVIVTADAGGISGTARIRIFPPLPWSFDFADKQVPITWIGAAYRHQPREVDGNSLLVKVTTIPKGTRSQAWIGPTDLHDYTIQADFKGAITNGKMPDMGLINQRYTLDLMGAKQQLQIRSWTSRLELRFAKTIPFAWKPDTWYTMKFQSQNQSGQAVLRGKVWPRGEKEPKDWTIEAADETPNVVGSPGLFGNASDAEIFIDNVKVTANDAPVAAASSKSK